MIGHQDPRQRHPAQLATRQAVEQAVQRNVGEQPGEHVTHAAIAQRLVHRPTRQHRLRHGRPGQRVLLREHPHA